MRTIQTYILRLLVDTEEPHAVRGLIHAAADDQNLPFGDGQALLALLCRMSGYMGQVPGQEGPGST